MKSLPQIEKEINRQLDKLDNFRGIFNPASWQTEAVGVLAYIKGMSFVFNKKERLSISEQTRERLIKAIKEYRDGQG